MFIFDSDEILRRLFSARAIRLSVAQNDEIECPCLSNDGDDGERPRPLVVRSLERPECAMAQGERTFTQQEGIGCRIPFVT